MNNVEIDRPLSERRKEYIRIARSTDPILLQRKASSEDPFERLMVAVNLHVPAATLLELKNDKIEFVGKTAADTFNQLFGLEDLERRLRRGRTCLDEEAGHVLEGVIKEIKSIRREDKNGMGIHLREIFLREA